MSRKASPALHVPALPCVYVPHYELVSVTVTMTITFLTCKLLLLCRIVPLLPVPELWHAWCDAE